MKNRKGFTLIELLAVIVILSSISIVTVVSVTSSLERRDVKECQEQVALAKNAAKIYFSLNGYDNNNQGVTVGCLMGEGDFQKCSEVYLEDKKTDKLNKNWRIEFDANGIYKMYNESNQEYVCPES